MTFLQAYYIGLGAALAFGGVLGGFGVWVAHWATKPIPEDHPARR